MSENAPSPKPEESGGFGVLIAILISGWIGVSCAGYPDLGALKIHTVAYNMAAKLLAARNKPDEPKPPAADPVSDINKSLSNFEAKKKILEEVLYKSRKSSDEIIGKIREMESKSTDPEFVSLTVKPLRDSFKTNYRQIKTLEVRLGQAEAAIFNAQIVLRQKELSKAGFSEEEITSIKQDLLNGEEILDGSKVGASVPEVTEDEVDRLLKARRK
jgi:hypothetical protein